MELDFYGLSSEEKSSVERAIAAGENFYGYVPGRALRFIARNYVRLADLKVLEEPWLDAYVFAQKLHEVGSDVIQAIWDKCDREKLRQLKPLVGVKESTKHSRISLFRGCAGSAHTTGMSWTTSLDKAIWYAAWHSAYNDLDNLAVYAATVNVAEVYCQLDRNEEEFIVRPAKVWRVDVPSTEFRLDRLR